MKSSRVRCTGSSGNVRRSRRSVVDSLSWSFLECGVVLLRGPCYFVHQCLVAARLDVGCKKLLEQASSIYGEPDFVTKVLQMPTH